MSCVIGRLCGGSFGLVLLAGGSEKLVYLCFKSSEVVFKSGGSLFAAIEFLECLDSRQSGHYLV